MTLTTDLSGPCSWDIRTTREALAAGRISHVEHLDALLERLPPAQRLGAVISADPELARAFAHALDRRETWGPLTGIPVAVEDIVDVAGFPTTGGTRALEDQVVGRDAPAVRRLREAGAILFLKTNLHELSFGTTSNNGSSGPVHHPLDPALAAGGSSGGSAVAVAVGLVPAAVAADTGGSSRIPAALCGIVGFRPTLGRYPSSGVLPIAHSRDTIGPMARTVDDVVLLDALLAGERPSGPPRARHLEVHDEGPGPLHGLRLGVPELFLRDLEPGVDSVFGAALRALEAAGAELVEVDISPAQDHAAAAGMAVALHEFLPDLEAYLADRGGGPSLEQIRRGIGSPDVRRIWELAEVFRAADDEYRAAQQARRLALRLYSGALEARGVTAVVQPTCPVTARPLGDDQTVELNGRRVPTSETFTRHSGLAGIIGTPGISLPAGRTAEGLPVGLELAAGPGSDAVLLDLARTVEALLREQ
ncbi:amidase family protein [Kocuria turfanensis]|uniref:Indole acetimide hydrolase n=1 Tax=Kocuria turfanensis TaxID=388357 RepID=A0A512ICX8_9MICC|nr:amidase family protein [Kocuria turfanensis]GEO95538.1 indole acetimide hydrolase [Kocuria turfanensis]